MGTAQGTQEGMGVKDQACRGQLNPQEYQLGLQNEALLVKVDNDDFRGVTEITNICEELWA